MGNLIIYFRVSAECFKEHVLFLSRGRSFVEANSDVLTGGANKSQLPGELALGVDFFHLVEALEETSQDVTSLGQGKLLANADTRATVEGKEFPSDTAADPAVRLELGGILTPDVLATVQDVGAVENGLTLLDVDGVLGIRATTNGQASVLGSVAGIDRQRREETQTLAHDVLEELTRLEVGEAEAVGVFVGAKGLDDVAAESGKDFRVSGEEKHCPGEKRGGGVAAGEENVEELRAKFKRVLGGGSEGVEEDVGRIRIFSLLLVLGLKGTGNTLVDKSVNLLAALLELLGIVQEAETRDTDTLGKVPLGVVKVLGEIGGEGTRRFTLKGSKLAVARLSEEHLGGGIQGQAEEDGLNVGFGPALLIRLGDDSHGVLYMSFLEAEVANLVASKLRSQHGARVCPFGSVGGEL